MNKCKIGPCLECPEGSPDKPVIEDRCVSLHYWPHRAKVRAEKAAKRAEINGEPIKTQAKPRTAINKQSKQRKKEAPIYKVEKDKFLSLPENQKCFIEGCRRKPTTIEHTAGRKGYADEWARDNKISLFLDVRFWAACCLEHNGELERNPVLSQRYQLSRITGKPKLIKEPVKVW